MNTSHKNKTLATFLAASLGSIGVHQFYLMGKKSLWAWLHFACLPLSLLLTRIFISQPQFATMLPFTLSLLAALFSALILGLKSDEKWDAQFNLKSDKKSDSTWPLALILVFTVGAGAVLLIYVMARSADLISTGGAYG